jgi:nucleotide-binding universal stress UspA family protein
MFKKILVALDGSRFGSRLLSYATEIAQRFGAELILLQVVKPVTPIPPPDGVVPMAVSSSGAEMAAKQASEQEKINMARAKRYLSSKVRSISSNIRASYHIVLGDPASSIIKFARKNSIDLLVIATHGRSGLKRAIMGSVADAVVRESGKPVLTIRPNKGSRS